MISIRKLFGFIINRYSLLLSFVYVNIRLLQSTEFIFVMCENSSEKRRFKILPMVLATDWHKTLLILFLMLGTSCAPIKEKENDNLSTNEQIVWPFPPQEPKIRYLYSFSKPADLGIKPGLLERFLNIFTGDTGNRMIKPYAIAVNEDMIAVTDPGLKAVHLFKTKPAKYTVIYNIAGISLVSPVGIAFGADVIYIADSTLGKIFVLNRDGKHQRTITGLTRPTGVTYHRENNHLYVTDTLEHRIVIFDDKGIQLDTFGSRGGAESEFNFPSFLTLYKDTLYVNDTMNFRIQAFNLERTLLSSFGELGDGSGQFAHSKGMGTDSEGHLYVADALSNYVQIFNSEGRFLLAFGGRGNEPGQFLLPAGLFINQNRIYVADSFNHRVQVFEFLGVKN